MNNLDLEMLLYIFSFTIIYLLARSRNNTIDLIHLLAEKKYKSQRKREEYIEKRLNFEIPLYNLFIIVIFLYTVAFLYYNL